MLARIYKPARSVMTSGPSYHEGWVLEYVPEERRWIEPLMGWTASRDMRQQVIMNFNTLEAAERYARRQGIPYRVIKPHKRDQIRKSYVENFPWDRPILWTH